MRRSNIEDALFKTLMLSSTTPTSNNFETILFPQDMIQDIYKLHWDIIHKST